VRIGYASGVFDTFHIGHLNLLRRASLLCDFLLVGVGTDDVVVANKGRPPLIPFEERLAIVRSVRYVDAAVGDPYRDRLDSWLIYRFDVLIKGDDWKSDPAADQLIGGLRQAGVPVEFLPYTVQTSSSRLRELVATLQ
jgi:glycerol-3-phosphate cytidylyltransferase